jgi:Flp pilus assembly pilin Flp
MQQIINNLWQEDDGVLSFEWTIIAVVVVFGIVGGLAAGRDAIIDELGDLAEAVMAFDQSFSFAGIPGIIDGAEYDDTPGVLTDCGRQAAGSFGVEGPNDVTGGA